MMACGTHKTFVVLTLVALVLACGGEEGGKHDVEGGAVGMAAVDDPAGDVVESDDEEEGDVSPSGPETSEQDEPAQETSEQEAPTQEAPVGEGTTPAPTDSEQVEKVVVGVYSYDAGTDTYTDLGRELEFYVGVVCQSWTRWVPNPRGDDPISEPHDHYNAADEVVYENDELTWVEYGPEHSQDEIDATCGAGLGGAPKRVNKTEYLPGNGTNQFFLKIKSVE